MGGVHAMVYIANHPQVSRMASETDIIILIGVLGPVLGAAAFYGFVGLIIWLEDRRPRRSC